MGALVLDGMFSGKQQDIPKEELHYSLWEAWRPGRSKVTAASRVYRESGHLSGGSRQEPNKEQEGVSRPFLRLFGPRQDGTSSISLKLRMKRGGVFWAAFNVIEKNGCLEKELSNRNR